MKPHDGQNRNQPFRANFRIQRLEIFFCIQSFLLILAFLYPQSWLKLSNGITDVSPYSKHDLSSSQLTTNINTKINNQLEKTKIPDYNVPQSANFETIPPSNKVSNNIIHATSLEPKSQNEDQVTLKRNSNKPQDSRIKSTKKTSRRNYTVQDKHRSNQHKNATPNHNIIFPHDDKIISRRLQRSASRPLIQLSSKLFVQNTQHCDKQPFLSPMNSLNNFTFDNRTHQIMLILQSLSSLESLSHFSSPQYRAACWILYDDELQILPDNELMIQRYILAVLIFSVMSNTHGVLKLPANVCDIALVTCNVKDEVTDITWRSNQLQGTIPSEISFLKSLETLDFSRNLLVGTIPSELGWLSNINTLALSKNALTGMVPPEIGDASNLTYIEISTNNLEGSVPSEIGKLGNLVFLHLSENNMDGSLPVELFNCIQLEDLALANNNFTGSIGHNFGQLQKLENVWLYGNGFSGRIPTEIGLLSSLETVLLYNNEFTGPMPKEIRNLESLELLWISGNQISGTLPNVFDGFTNLTQFEASNNELSGELPESLWAENLWGSSLQLHNNKLVGTIPDSVCDNGSVRVDTESWFLDEPRIKCDCCGKSHCNLWNVNGLETRNIQSPPPSLKSPKKTKKGKRQRRLQIQSGQGNNRPKGSGDNEREEGVEKILSNSDETRQNNLSLDHEGKSGVNDSSLESGQENNHQQDLSDKRENDLFNNPTLNNNLGDESSKNQSNKSPSNVEDDTDMNNINVQNDGKVNKKKRLKPVEPPICPQRSVHSISFASDLEISDMIADVVHSETIGDGSGMSEICLSPSGCYSISYVSDQGSSEIDFMSYSAQSKSLKRQNRCDSVEVCGVSIDSSNPKRPGLNHLTQLTTPDLSILNKPRSPEYNALCWMMTEDSLFDVFSICDGTLLQRYVILLFYLTYNLSINFDELRILPTCEWPGITCRSKGKFVNEMDFANNNLEGSLITEIGLLTSLERLDLSNNELRGKLESSLFSNMPNLEVFNVGNNSFEDKIPQGLFEVPWIKEVNASNNLFDHSLPNFFHCSDSIESIDLQKNVFGGNIEADLAMCKNLKYLDLSFNYFRGVIPTELGELDKLEALHLNNNLLTGSIPVQIFNASLLESFMLQGNKLTGSIPTQIGTLQHAKSIVLNHNAIKGEIPSELGDLNSLTTLYLHKNFLAGTAPSFEIERTGKEFEYISDCGGPFFLLPSSLECDTCTVCCNSNGDCQFNSHWGDSIALTAFILVVCIPVALALILNIIARVKGWAEKRQDKDLSHIYKNDSVYCLIFSENRIAFVVYIFTVAIQSSILNVFLRASSFNFTKSDWRFSLQCLSNNLECNDLSTVTAYGQVLFYVVTFVFLGVDFIQSIQQVLSGAVWQDSRLFVSGIIISYLTGLTLFTTAAYNWALADSDTDLIVNAVILLFVDDMDEKILEVIQSSFPSWLEKRFEEIDQRMHKTKNRRISQIVSKRDVVNIDAVSLGSGFRASCTPSDSNSDVSLAQEKT